MIYESKQCKGLQYVTHKASSGKGTVIEVKYKDKQVMISPRKVEVKPTLVMLETVIPRYADVMEDAYMEYDYDKGRAAEMRTKLYEVFNTYAKRA